MKKKLTMLVSLILCLSLLAGCCLSHDWKDATCEDPKTCAKCGKTEGEALDHDWEDATCEEPKTCSECGETRGKAKDHDWQDAACEEPMTCSECGQTEGEPLGHQWEGLACTVCGMTLSLEQMYPEGELRFNETNFLFDYTHFIPLYIEKLAEFGMEFTDGGVRYETPTINAYYLNYNGQRMLTVDLYMNEDGTVKRVTVKNSGNVSSQAMIDLVTQACLISAHVCHGDMDQEKWENLMENPASQFSTSTRDSITYKTDGIKISVDVKDDGIEVTTSIG